jgi:phosphoribosylformylglycinamidine synthase
MGGAYAATGFGMDVDLQTYGSVLPALTVLFSESHSRAVITCPPDRASAVVALAQELGVPVARVGSVGPRGGALRLKLRETSVDVSVDRLRDVYFSGVPRRMGD